MNAGHRHMGGRVRQGHDRSMADVTVLLQVAIGERAIQSSIAKPTCPRHGARHFLALTRDPLLTVLADHRHDRISRRHLLVGIGRDRVKWTEAVDTPVPWESRSFRGRRYHDGCRTGQRSFRARANSVTVGNGGVPAR